MDVTAYASTIAAGAAAGAVGTLAMDLVWFARARRSGSDEHFADFEFSRDTTSFDDAGTPAQVGRKAAALVGVDLSDSSAGTANDVVHWMTGVGWAIGGSIVAATTGINPATAGVLSGVAAFAGAYTVLPMLGLYEPIWRYDAPTLWRDASAHTIFGAATGATLAGIRSFAASRANGPIDRLIPHVR